MKLVYLLDGTAQIWHESALDAHKAYPRKDVAEIKDLFCNCIKSIDQLVKLYPRSESSN